MGLRREYKPSAWIRIGLLVLLLVIVVWATSCGLGAATKDKKQDWRPTQEIATMERLFEVALEPVGKTMYVWGGGWDPDDAKAGTTATQIGMPKAWADFAKEQTKDYDFEEYLENPKQQEYWGRNLQELGLDCSGYVGWVMYNLFQEKDGKEGYVSQSTGMAEALAERGWGQFIRNPREFLSGDIVSMMGHVWICLGTCEDGSVLLVHSSPPGVSVCGTEGIATQLATEYMTIYHSKWQGKYPNRTVPLTYLENVTVLRWNSNTLKNAKTYQEKTGEEMMGNLMSRN
ncbi:MAG: hypothetical protein J6B96_05260 [Agathobacter sp.]|nr:hypothetical protein [Agathobacter sp.]